jgi:hypothetical protein
VEYPYNSAVLSSKQETETPNPVPTSKTYEPPKSGPKWTKNPLKPKAAQSAASDPLNEPLSSDDIPYNPLQIPLFPRNPTGSGSSSDGGHRHRNPVSLEDC